MEVAVHNQQVQKSKRQWIYAKKPGGKLFQMREWVGYTLLLFLFSAPFIKINGNPLVMFNIVERKFSILGVLFYPQDLHIFVFGMLIMMVAIVLFTVVFGRVWCGWTCPQTVFMELIFRRIEYWIEGDWQQQRKMNEGPDTDMRAWKKLLKHSIFLFISFLISNLFLSYIIGVDALWTIMTDPVDAHLGGFIAISVFTLVFYAVFAFVREIVCTTICPYGRLQSVLIDDKTTIVAYDVDRGEPRGKKSKQANTPLGDCVDCKLCVHVCPTGIDIRNGIQMECVSCTACIDACDAVMDKIGKPTRLIGFYNNAQINGTDTASKNNNRLIAYSLVLIILVGVFGFMLFNRSIVDGRLLRAKGSTYHIKDDGTVSNLYTLELINKSGKDIQFSLEPADANMKIQKINQIDSLRKDGKATLSFFLSTDQKNISTYKTNVQVQIISQDKVVDKMKTTFICPPNG